MVQQLRAMLTILRRVRAQVLRQLEKAEVAAHEAEAALTARAEWANDEEEKIDRLRWVLNDRENRMENLLDKAHQEDKRRQHKVDELTKDLATNDAGWKKMGCTPPE